MRRIVTAAMGVVLGTVLTGMPTAAQTSTNFVNFEGSQTNPIRISADGTRLYAVNTPNGTLSVFDLSSPSRPNLIAEIPVGIEPVSVNPRTDDEVWVVNQVSGSVSVVSVSKGIVTDTLYARGEPSDVVFAGSNLAFVSVRRDAMVNVYSTQAPHSLVAVIPLVGDTPRAMAVSADGSKVYVAFALSGNHTTIIPASDAPAQPPPVNKALPPPPQVALIIDASNPAIPYTMPDNDVAVINTASLSVSQYYSRVGAVNLGLAVQPQTGNLYVANTQALNTVHFACANPGCPTPNLTGHWVDSRITPITVATNTVGAPINLNPGINYSILPNPAALASALAQPTNVVFEPTGRYLYIAAFGTDRVGVLDTSTGKITALIEIGQTPGTIVNSTLKRGPRGLALNGTTQRLYVLNRIYNTISVVNTSQNTVLEEIPNGSADPTPSVIRQGRGFLYDAKLSGNGTGACASCHVDAEIDMLAWDLGDPTGSMETVVNNGNTLQEHPMKGPMTTQSLRGLNSTQPYHWRGDKPNFAAFNEAFTALMGGPQLSTSQMTAFTNFINTIVYAPNPNQNIDRTLPTSVLLPYLGGAVGNPVAGQAFFENGVAGSSVCNSCHTFPGVGTNLVIDTVNVGTGTPLIQPIKVPQLRNQYQRVGFNNTAGEVSIDGFGLLHDGTATPMDLLFAVARNARLTEREDLLAFQLCFDTGTSPAVGFTVTLASSNVTGANSQAGWNQLEGQAATGNTIDLIGRGTLNGRLHGVIYNPAANNYRTDTVGLGPFTRAQLTTMIQNGDIVSLIGVPPGTGQP